MSHGFPQTLCCNCHGAVDQDNYAEDELDVWCSWCWRMHQKALASDAAEEAETVRANAEYAAEQALGNAP